MADNSGADQIGKNLMPELGICAQLARKADYDDVPIKEQRAFKELEEFFNEETVFVARIGLNQIQSDQLQQISKPRHYLDCGGAAPLGWDLSVPIGAKVDRLTNRLLRWQVISGLNSGWESFL